LPSPYISFLILRPLVLFQALWRIAQDQTLWPKDRFTDVTEFFRVTSFLTLGAEETKITHANGFAAPTTWFLRPFHMCLFFLSLCDAGIRTTLTLGNRDRFAAHEARL
jgi:hypothetical protein